MPETVLYASAWNDYWPPISEPINPLIPSLHCLLPLLEVSPATVKRDWTYARAWLYERIAGESEG